MGDRILTSILIGILSLGITLAFADGSTPQINLNTSGFSTNEGNNWMVTNNFFSDPDSSEWTATVDYGDGLGPLPLFFDVNKSFDLSHTYTDDGMFTVIIQVTDFEGNTGEDSFEVIVNNVDPNMVIDSTAIIDENQPFSMSGSSSDAGSDEFSGTADYGDASPIQDVPVQTDGSFVLNHSYSDNGEYTVIVTIEDDDGGSDTKEIAVTVHNVAPIVDAGSPLLAIVGNPIGLEGSTCDDVPADTHMATIDWGDATSDGPYSVDCSLEINATHTYAMIGQPTITLCIKDDDDGQTCDTTTVEVNAPPSVMIDSPLDGSTFLEGGLITLEGSAQDDEGVDLTDQIRWTTGIDTFLGTGGIVEKLNFAPGTHVITSSVTDSDGLSDSDSIQIQVNPQTPETILANMGEKIQELIENKDLKKGVGKSWLKSVEGIMKSIEKKNNNSACGKLGAMFNKISAKEGKQLSLNDSDELKDYVNSIRSNLGCY